MTVTFRSTVDDPVQLDPFLNLTGVHWKKGGLAVVELVTVINFAGVFSFKPDEGEIDQSFFNFGDVLKPDDYKDFYIGKLGNAYATGEQMIAENEIKASIVDGVLSGPVGDSTTNSAAVEGGNSAFGYHYSARVTGGFAVWNLTTTTQPDGHKVTYYSDYTVKSHWYPTTDVYGNPVPAPPANVMVDYSPEFVEFIWYRSNTIPAVKYDLGRQSWIVQFSSEKVILAMIQGSPGIRADYHLRTFQSGVTFKINNDATIDVTNADGTPAVPSFEGSGSAADGTIRYFNASGFQ